MDQTIDYSLFESLHRNQLESSNISKLYWRPLYDKLIAERFDSAHAFRIELIQHFDDDCDASDVNDASVHFDTTCRVLVSNEDGIDISNEQHIYLIDHMWTYRLDKAKYELNNNNSLLQRLTNIINIKCDLTDNNKPVIINEILKQLWKYNNSYSIDYATSDNSSMSDNAIPIWYIMDEFGLSIQHSNDANFRCVPFYYIPNQLAYNLLFPIKNVKCGEEVTRNFMDGVNSSDDLRQTLLQPWFPSDISHIDYRQVESDEPFIQNVRIEEALSPNQTTPKLPQHRKIKVYSDYSYINEYLANELFEITETKGDADILWLNTHFKQFDKLLRETPNVFINQFPYEHIITVKDLFSIVCRRCKETIDESKLETSPHWLATTYNLQTEIEKFVSYFQTREKLKLDNTWIVKPWNLARGLDTTVTDDLNCIIRLRNSIPKVVCKYITNPVLFLREDLNNSLVKFDFRYIVLLQSVSPLKVYVYRKFWLRFANKPFSLDNFEDYEKHFTVMNYIGGDTQLKQMECQQFIELFNKQYEPLYRWQDIEKNVLKALKAVFECATSKPTPFGIAANLQSRAMYAADIMLEWRSDAPNTRPVMQPVILEMNWAPDCERACLYYNHFFNDIFSLLFLDLNSNNNFTLLS